MHAHPLHPVLSALLYLGEDMTNPIPPADLNELERKLSKYPPEAPIDDDAAELIADALDALPALIAAARERDVLWARNEGLIETLRKDPLVHRAEKAEKELDTLRVELAAARAALSSVTWRTDTPGEGGPYYCAVCRVTDGHSPTCALAVALGKEHETPTGLKGI